MKVCPISAISVTTRQLSRCIWFNTSKSNVSMRVYNIDLASVSVISVVSPLLLHGYTNFISALSMNFRPITVISETTRQLSRFIWFNTSSVSVKESNTIFTSAPMKALTSLLLEGTKRQNTRVFNPPVQSVQYVQFKQCVHLVQ